MKCAGIENIVRSCESPWPTTVIGSPSPRMSTASFTASNDSTYGMAREHTGPLVLPGRGAATTLARHARGGTMKPDEVKKVAVIGCGLMGSGITEVSAKSGMDVAFVEISDEKVQKQKGRIEKSISKAVEKGKLSQEDAEAAIGRITGTTDQGAAGDADLVIEAVTEDLDTKLDVFRRLDDVTRDDVVLASNTSSLPIGEMAAATKRPDRVLGMHFFNHLPVMKLLVLVLGYQTS